MNKTQKTIIWIGFIIIIILILQLIISPESSYLCLNNANTTQGQLICHNNKNNFNTIIIDDDLSNLSNVSIEIEGDEFKIDKYGNKIPLTNN